MLIWKSVPLNEINRIKNTISLKLFLIQPKATLAEPAEGDTKTQGFISYVANIFIKNLTLTTIDCPKFYTFEPDDEQKKNGISSFDIPLPTLNPGQIHFNSSKKNNAFVVAYRDSIGFGDLEHRIGQIVSEKSLMVMPVVDPTYAYKYILEPLEALAKDLFKVSDFPLFVEDRFPKENPHQYQITMPNDKPWELKSLGISLEDINILLGSDTDESLGLMFRVQGKYGKNHFDIGGKNSYKHTCANEGGWKMDAKYRDKHKARLY